MLVERYHALRWLAFIIAYSIGGVVRWRKNNRPPRMKYAAYDDKCVCELIVQFGSNDDIDAPVFCTACIGFVVSNRSSFTKADSSNFRR